MELEKKQYKVWVIPHVGPKQDDPNNQGAKLPGKATYIRTSNPDETAQAVVDQDGKKVFLPQRFIHLQVFEEGNTSFLGGDTKPATVNIFENSDRILFGKLEQVIGDKERHEVMKTDAQVMVLKDSLPGLVRNRDISPRQYYATYRDSNGKTQMLKMNRRQNDGNFKEEPVVMTTVSYFLFDNKVNADDDAIEFNNELNRITNWVKGATPEDVGTAQVGTEQGAKEKAA